MCFLEKMHFVASMVKCPFSEEMCPKMKFFTEKWDKNEVFWREKFAILQKKFCKNGLKIEVFRKNGIKMKNFEGNGSKKKIDFVEN